MNEINPKWLRDSRQTAQGQMDNYQLHEQSYIDEVVKNSFPGQNIKSVIPYCFSSYEDFGGIVGANVNTLYGYFTLCPLEDHAMTVSAINDKLQFVELTFGGGGNNGQSHTFFGLAQSVVVNGGAFQFLGWKTDAYLTNPLPVPPVDGQGTLTVTIDSSAFAQDFFKAGIPQGDYFSFQVMKISVV
jgi:hypothetical protein